jgi:type II secretory pathway pseudopilin PulG
VSITSRIASTAGISLVEVIVATALLATSIIGVAQLFAVAIGSNIASQTVTCTTVLAAQKLEHLRSDTRLTPSPPRALEEDTPGHVDYVDAWGSVLDERGPPDGARYVRRWSVRPSPADPENTFILQVRVARVGPPASRERLPGEAWLVTVRTKVAP